MGVCFMAKSKLTKWLTKKGKQQLYELAHTAMTDKELYTALNINCDTFYEYMRNCSEFSEIVKRARADRDDTLRAQVLESFVKNKLLGSHKKTEKRTSTTTYASGEQSTVEETREWDEGPDTTAQIFFLKTQCGWNDRQFVTITNGDEIDPFSASIMNELSSRGFDAEPLPETKDDDDDGFIGETEGDI